MKHEPPVADATESEDLDTQHNRLVQAWHEYGETFSVFLPEDQPAPDEWDPVIPNADDKGRLDPQALKHWRYLYETKEFVSQRYAQYGILQSPSLWFDCMVGTLRKPLRAKLVVPEEGIFEEVDESHEWYRMALRIGLFGWQVGFSCRSMKCERDRCILHRRNPKRVNPIDVLGLVRLFEGVGMAKAVAEVSRWFGVKLGALDSKGGQETIYRYRVPKKAIQELIHRHREFRHQYLNEFIRECRKLIQGSELVPWHPRLFHDDFAFLSRTIIDNLYLIKRPAIKAYLWLLLHQEEKARNVRDVEIRVSDADLVRALGVSRTTAKAYRDRLTELALIEIEERFQGKKKVVTVRKVNYTVVSSTLHQTSIKPI